MELGHFIPSEEVAFNYTNAQLRLDLRDTTGEFTPYDAAGFRECNIAYVEARRDHEASQRQLIAALSSGSVQAIETYNDIKLHTSWHQGDRQAGDGTVFPVAYCVQVVEQNGVLVEHQKQEPVTVLAYPLYRLDHQNYPNFGMVMLTGSRADMCYSRDHGTGKVMESSEVKQRRLEEILDDVHQQITDAALTEALQSYSEELAQQPGVDIAAEVALCRDNPKAAEPEWRIIFRALSVSAHGSRAIFNVSQTSDDAAFMRFMAEKAADPAAALVLLKEAVSAKNFKKIDTMLRQDYASLQKDLERAPGLETRYKWIIANLLPMKRAADKQVGKALHAHFKDTFMAALAVEKAKTAELRSLASSITVDTVPINDSIPVSNS